MHTSKFGRLRIAGFSLNVFAARSSTVVKQQLKSARKTMSHH